MQKTNLTKKINTASAFTLIEMIVSISIVGILLAISVVSYGSWKTVTIKNVAKSDLTNIISALENYRNFNNVYPSDIATLSNFKASNGVSITGGSGDGKTYCVNAVSTTDTTIKFYVSSSSNGKVMSGTCGVIDSPDFSPVTSVAVNGSNIQATITPVTCTVGTPQYSVHGRVDDGIWGSYSPWSTALIYTRSSSVSTKYGYQAQARCYLSDSQLSFTSTGIEGTYRTGPAYIEAPLAPTIAVVLSGSDVQATITAVTCLSGTVQYAVSYRVNDGVWGSYSAWSTDLISSQSADDGVKYGYKAKARCSFNAETYSSDSIGEESIYIKPIAAPTAPVIAANTVADTTTWSWPNVTCANGTTARYQYQYTISPSGYNSGWTSNNSNLSVAFTTSTTGETYSVAVQAQCYNTNATSSWSASGSANYYRPMTGLLASLGTIATGTNPRDIAISNDGTSVYVSNYDSNTISMYSRNTSTGVLTALSPATIASSSGPTEIAISPDDTSVYVTNWISATISMFSRNTSTGLLTALSPATISSSGTGPNGITISPDGLNIYAVNSSSSKIAMFSRNTSTKLLTILSPSTVTTAANSYRMVVSPDGKSLYNVNKSPNSLTMFSRNAGTGLLTALSPASIAAGTDPTKLDISPDNNSVYAANYTSNTVSMYSRNTTTGLLTALSPATIATGTNPKGVAVSYDNLSVYVSNSGSNTISMYNRNTTTGLLTAKSPATIAATVPASIVISNDDKSVYTIGPDSNIINMYSRN